MGLSDCPKCGGHIPLGPHATNRCENCDAFVFDAHESGAYAESENLRKALLTILEMGNECGMIDAQMIAAMAINPDDYSKAARNSQGLL